MGPFVFDESWGLLKLGHCPRMIPIGARLDADRRAAVPGPAVVSHRSPTVFVEDTAGARRRCRRVRVLSASATCDGAATCSYDELRFRE